jgi:hypothetical protein
MSQPQLLRTARHAACTFVLALPLAASASEMALDAHCAPQLTPLEQRIQDRAGVGPDALRQFLWIRRDILQLDIYDTAARFEALGNARASCLEAQAIGQPLRASAR